MHLLNDEFVKLKENQIKENLERLKQKEIIIKITIICKTFVSNLLYTKLKRCGLLFTPKKKVFKFVIELV